MFEVLGKNQTLVAVGLLILVPLVVYRANARQVADANPLEKLVLTLTSPVERALSFGVEEVSDAYAHYVDAIGARSENIELRQKMRKMSVEAERARSGSRLGTPVRAWWRRRSWPPVVRPFLAPCGSTAGSSTAWFEGRRCCRSLAS